MSDGFWSRRTMNRKKGPPVAGPSSCHGNAQKIAISVPVPSWPGLG